MQTQSSNEEVNNLAARINADLAQPQQRYRLYDPASETTLHFPRAQLATAKADELGATSFETLAANGQTALIKKSENQWTREDGKPLAHVQTQIEKESLDAIEARAVLRKTAGQGVDAVTDKQLVAADLQAFKRIEHLALQESAAAAIADNAQAYPSYKQALDTGIAAYPNAAVQIAALAAANTEKVNARDEAKWIEAQTILLAREARAKKWTQDDAQKQAQADSKAFQEALDKSERNALLDEIAFNAKANLAYKASLEANALAIAAQIATEKTPVEITQKPAEMVLDPLALNRVAEVRKRDSAQLREILEMNSIEVSLKKEIKLDGEAEAKRSAWLKKGQAVPDTESKPEAAAPTANTVESDEIFAAGKADIKPIIPAEIEKQFLRVGDKFYHPKNKESVAFEDKGHKLETKSNSENIALTMVRLAEARGWDEIKVSGSEAFRREVWLDAAARSMQVKGYTPTEQDKAEMEKRLGSAKANKIEPESKPFRARETKPEKETNATQLTSEKPNTPDKSEKGALIANTPEKLDKAAVALNTPDKQFDSPQGQLNFAQMAKAFASQTPEEATKSFPALASAAAVLKIVEKKAEADGLNAEQRVIVTTRARENIASKINQGNMPKVNVSEKIEVNRDRVLQRDLDR